MPVLTSRSSHKCGGGGGRGAGETRRKSSAKWKKKGLGAGKVKTRDGNWDWKVQEADSSYFFPLSAPFPHPSNLSVAAHGKLIYSQKFIKSTLLLSRSRLTRKKVASHWTHSQNSNDDLVMWNSKSFVFTLCSLFSQGGRFPIKWMAIESLLDGVSTTKSDV